MIDLLVAGAGPAGAATAIRAALAGLQVAVVEPRRSPIDKACGEGIAHSAVHELAELGVEPPGRPFVGIRYLDSAGHQAEALFRDGPGLGVRRTVLQAAFRERLKQLEIPVIPGRIEEIDQARDHVEAAGIKARYLAAADGLHSPIRRKLGLEIARGGSTRHGLRRHFAIEPWTDLVEVYWSPTGEAYVTPVAHDLVGVAVLTSERKPYDELLRAFPTLRKRLVDPAGPVMGAGPLRQRVRRRVSGRVLLVGDAAGYVDALTGEGISVALRTSAELVRCVRAGRPRAYELAWRRASWECRFLTGSLLWARNRSVIGARIVPAAERLPGVFTSIVNRLA
ncbi:NAD(P)/FAD-dependent oxidoreductase [Kribbella deserti]|uniref:NAD(P)/FAD-dependent oxidoreductase n=1 Tax=Kribbella deserti TaxID=1926257 RepID=A0ABV6QE97_9ACTN